MIRDYINDHSFSFTLSQNICDDQVDIAYIPFVERFQPVSIDVFKHDITEGRPKLATWIEVHYSQLCVKKVPFLVEISLSFKFLNLLQNC